MVPVKTMITIFGADPLASSRFEGVARALGLSLVTAVVCVMLTYLYFAVAFAAGESHEPIPASAVALLCATALGIAALGYWTAWWSLRFSWLPTVFTPLVVLGIFWLPGAGWLQSAAWHPPSSSVVL
jgi:hypothetical protein